MVGVPGFWPDFDQILVRLGSDVDQMLARFKSDFDSSTGTEKYSFTVPPGLRKAIGKPSIKQPISSKIPYIKNLAAYSSLKGFTYTWVDE